MGRALTGWECGSANWVRCVDAGNFAIFHASGAGRRVGSGIFVGRVQRKKWGTHGATARPAASFGFL